jgi:predicted nucleic acid-binding Zn ribbon protein
VSGADPGPEPEARRTGLDVARQALAAAKAEAARRGTAVRRGSGDQPAPGTSWRARRAAAEQRSGAHPDERDPQRLGATVDRLLVERGWQGDAAVGGVMGRWAAVVGAEIAAHSEPVSFDAEAGELVVQAESTAWATELRLLAPVLLARLAEELGERTVTYVKVLGPRAPSWRRGRLSVRGRGARDTYG